MKKQVTLIGMNESLGFPFRYHGKSRRAIQDHLLEILRDHYLEKNYDVKYLNLFSMLFNKTWHIDSVLRHNLTLEELRNMISSGNNAARNSILTKLGMPKELGYLDQVSEKEKDVKIRDFLSQNEETIFVYDAGINNFMYHLNHNFFVATTEYKHSRFVTQRLEETNLINQVVKEVKDNIELILNIQPKARILILGFSLSFYNFPLFHKLYLNFPTYQKIQKEIEVFNRRLKRIENDYPVRFIDTSSFPHCSKSPDLLIEKIEKELKKEIPKINNKRDNAPFLDDFGYEGMLADVQKRLLALKEQKKFKTEEEQIRNASQIEKNQQELAIFVNLKKEASKERP